MSKSKAQGSIKKLLEAEQRASEIVKEAKKSRLLRLKQARDEAAKEIQRYKETRDNQFKEFKEKTLGSSTSVEEIIAKQVKTEKQAIEKRASAQKQEVVDLLLKFVTEVDKNPNLKQIPAA